MPLLPPPLTRHQLKARSRLPFNASAVLCFDSHSLRFPSISAHLGACSGLPACHPVRVSESCYDINRVAPQGGEWGRQQKMDLMGLEYADPHRVQNEAGTEKGLDN